MEEKSPDTAKRELIYSLQLRRVLDKPTHEMVVCAALEWYITAIHTNQTATLTLWEYIGHLLGAIRL